MSPTESAEPPDSVDAALAVLSPAELAELVDLATALRREALNTLAALIPEPRHTSRTAHR